MKGYKTMTHTINNDINKGAAHAKLTTSIRRALTRYRRDDEGLAALEAVMLFPIMVSMVFGLYDLGHAIILNQKVVSACHIAADLLARKPAVSDADIQDAIEAAKLAVDPYDRAEFGIDIASILFNEDDDPTVLWRETEGMNANANIPSQATGLGLEGEGVLAVTATYAYTPFFYKMLFNDIKMQEVSFLRGRKTSVIRHEDMI